MIPGSAHSLLTSQAFVFNPTLSGTTNQNFNLRAAAIAAGWDTFSPLIANITLAAGAVLGSSSVATLAFDTGAGFPAGTQLSLALLGGAYLVGAGGAGGSGGGWFTSYCPCGGATVYTPVAAGGGGTGGPALRAQYPLTVTNGGVIGGGGNGGSGGAPGQVYIGCCVYQYEGSGGGGGGAGYVAGSGGSAGTISGSSSGSNGNPGGGGSLASGGSGGSGANSGGSGSGLGGGACTIGNTNITWAVTGTRYGALT